MSQHDTTLPRGYNEQGITLKPDLRLYLTNLLGHIQPLTGRQGSVKKMLQQLTRKNVEIHKNYSCFDSVISSSVELIK